MLVPSPVHGDAGMTIFGVAVVKFQSSEQRCREVEAADVASVARMVRGVCSIAVELLW